MKLHSSVKALVLTAAMTLTFMVSAFSAAHITMNVNGCTVSGTTVQFNVTITNDGDVPLSLNSALFGIVHGAGILQGSPSVTVSYVGNSDFPGLFAVGPGVGGSNTYNLTYSAANRRMTLTTSAGVYNSGNAIAIPVGQTRTVGTFRFSNTISWAEGQDVALTWNATISGAVLYVDGTSTSFNTTAGNTTLGAPCSLTTPVACNLTAQAGSATAVTCHGGSNGSITVTLSGTSAGTSGTYVLGANPPQPFNSNPFVVSGLSAGSHTITATVTANGCQASTGNFNIGGPGAPITHTENATICQGQLYTLPGDGGEVGSQGTYGPFVLQAANGCDSTVTVNLTVNSPASGSITNLASFYDINDAPVVLNGTPSGGSFSGTGITGGTTFNPSVAGVGGPYTITYTYTSNGCTGTAQAQTTVTDGCTAPTAVLSITRTPIGRVCEGYVINFTAKGATGTITGYKWTLTPVNTTAIIKINGVEYTEPVITATNVMTAEIMDYQIGTRVDLYAEALSGSCVGPFKRVSILKGAPAAPAITGPTTACGTDVRTYTVPLVAVNNYTWGVTGNASISSGQGTNQVQITFASNWAGGTVTCFQSNDCGIGTVKTKAIGTGNIPPTPGTISIAGGAAKVCPGESRTYSIPALSTASTYTYTISGAGALINGSLTSLTTASTSISVSFNENFEGVSLSVVANNGCGSSASPKILNINGNILPVPSSLTMNGGLVPVCPGTEKNFTVAAVAGADSYTWTMPAGTALINGQADSYTGTELTVEIEFLSPFSATASSKLTVTANNDCGAGKPRSLTIQRNTIGPISLIAGDLNSNCNTTKQYSVTQANANATSFEWSWSVAPTPVNSATITHAASTDNFVSIQFSDAFSNGTLQVRAVNACGATPYKTRVLKGAPAAPAAITGPLSVCNNEVTEYEYSTAGSPGATSYVWTEPRGAFIVPGSKVDNLPGGSSTIRYTFDATYTGTALRVNAYTECGSAYKTLPGIVVSCPGPRLAEKNNAAVSSSVELYPNPATERATVRFSSASSANYSLVLRDITGREVMTREGAAVEGLNFIELNLSELPKGVYMVSLSTGDQRNTLRLVTE